MYGIDGQKGGSTPAEGKLDIRVVQREIAHAGTKHTNISILVSRRGDSWGHGVSWDFMGS
jgi:hypothetical protein